jgi:polar amino acid transport system permease protein
MPSRHWSGVVLRHAARKYPTDLVSNTVDVVKLTASASVVWLWPADMDRVLTFNLSPVVLAAILYHAMLWLLVRLGSRLGRSAGASKQQKEG